MAQLNPNFEIDFEDINSYEQIQLINDTQLAKENLLMHKAYREPAEDEIIRNQFSSFTFVDFCPKLMSTPGAGGAQCSSRGRTPTPTSLANGAPPAMQPRSPPGSGSSSLRAHQYELETFSDLFERINVWLRLNKDWRVVSMETLVFDCTSQFNHLKSSIHASNLPRNMRGLRLYLSPSKSRFSGPQKIGCINVIPRKTRGSYTATRPHDGPAEPLEYETLDEILARLNELLLTRPIEGRILSVETITLPIVNGYVNTETNYLLDNRLNLLSQRAFSHASQAPPANGGQQEATTRLPTTGGGGSGRHQRRPVVQSGLIDILRVYYEFGPMVCGLVNLIDFLPRLQLHQPAATGVSSGGGGQPGFEAGGAAEEQQQQTTGCGAIAEVESSESLTRLVRRSLAWFEAERKRFLQASGGSVAASETSTSSSSSSSSSSESEQESRIQQSNGGEETQKTAHPGRRQQPVVDLKVCNLQIHTRALLKSQLLRADPSGALERPQTGRMYHAAPREPIVCHVCHAPSSTLAGAQAPAGLSSATHEPQEWCAHLLDLNQAYELKFVRLAYVVPVSGAAVSARRLASSLRSLPSLRAAATAAAASGDPLATMNALPAGPSRDLKQTPGLAAQAPMVTRSRTATPRSSRNSTSSSSSSSSSSSANSEAETGSQDSYGGEEQQQQDELQEVDELLAMHAGTAEELAKRASLDLVHETNGRHRESERAHHASEEEQPAADQQQQQQLIGQLTYRLFAPCQLVNSSSCFAINPVNSSNPLARRGSVDLNGTSSSGGGGGAASLSSENATPSTLLIPHGASSSGMGSDLLGESTLSLNQQGQNQLTGSGASHQCKQQIISFGAFFPALSAHDIIGSSASSNHHHHHHHPSSGSNPTSSSYRFNTNEFESVEAIRRRMEVYVTTNSMKVLAGETLVVNLSDHLSCLSSAIEQTLVKVASFAPGRAPSTWVSVYVLYAAVDEPHLPSQLLEAQRARERLALISEESAAATATAGGVPSAPSEGARQINKTTTTTTGSDNMVPVFDDDFKGAPEVVAQQQQVASAMASLNLADGSIRVERAANDSAAAATAAASELSLYNSAYDRTVALPTQPDSHMTAASYLEPVDFNLNGWPYSAGESAGGGGAEQLWLDEHDLIDVQSYQLSESSVRDAAKLLRLRKVQQLLAESPTGAAAAVAAANSRRGRKSKKRGGGNERRGAKLGRSAREDSQCSIM